jgi:hypothetical protein
MTRRSDAATARRRSPPPGLVQMPLASRWAAAVATALISAVTSCPNAALAAPLRKHTLRLAHRQGPTSRLPRDFKLCGRRGGGPVGGLRCMQPAVWRM